MVCQEFFFNKKTIKGYGSAASIKADSFNKESLYYKLTSNET